MDCRLLAAHVGDDSFLVLPAEAQRDATTHTTVCREVLLCRGSTGTQRVLVPDRPLMFPSGAAGKDPRHRSNNNDKSGLGPMPVTDAGGAGVRGFAAACVGALDGPEPRMVSSRLRRVVCLGASGTVHCGFDADNETAFDVHTTAPVADALWDDLGTRLFCLLTPPPSGSPVGIAGPPTSPSASNHNGIESVGKHLPRKLSASALLDHSPMVSQAQQGGAWCSVLETHDTEQRGAGGLALVTGTRRLVTLDAATWQRSRSGAAVPRRAASRASHQPPRRRRQRSPQPWAAAACRRPPVLDPPTVRPPHFGHFAVNENSSRRRRDCLRRRAAGAGQRTP